MRRRRGLKFKPPLLIRRKKRKSFRGSSNSLFGEMGSLNSQEGLPFFSKKVNYPNKFSAISLPLISARRRRKMKKKEPPVPLPSFLFLFTVHIKRWLLRAIALPPPSSFFFFWGGGQIRKFGCSGSSQATPQKEQIKQPGARS